MPAVAIHPLAGIQRIHPLILEIPQVITLQYQVRPTLTGTIVIVPEVKTRVGVILMKTMIIRLEAMIRTGTIKPVTNQVIRNMTDPVHQDLPDQGAMVPNAEDNQRSTLL
jgi:hypothetical protein